MSISLDVVIPFLNEERALPVCIRRLHAFMSEHMGRYEWGIVVADNGSTDGTLDAAGYNPLTNRNRRGEVAATFTLDAENPRRAFRRQHSV